MTRTVKGLLVLIVIIMTVLAGCGSQGDKKEEVKSGKAQKPEEETVEGENVSEESEGSETESSEENSSTEMQQVISSMLEFQYPEADLDPAGVLEYDNTKERDAFDQSGYPVNQSTEMENVQFTSVTGDGTYKQMNMLRQILASVTNDKNEPLTIKRYQLYHAVAKPDGVEAPYALEATFDLIWDQWDQQNQTVTFESSSDAIPYEVEGMALRLINLYEGSLYVTYTEATNIQLSTAKSEKRLTMKYPIQQDGSLGDGEKVFEGDKMSRFYIQESRDAIIPTSKGEAFVDRGFGLAPFGDKGKGFTLKDVDIDPRNDTVLFYNEETNMVLVKKQEGSGIALYNIKEDLEIEGSHQLNDLDYVDYAFAGYDPEKEYLYVLAAMEHDEYGVESNIHVLDKEGNEVGDIYPVNTTTMDVTTLPDGFILWSTGGDPVQHIASKALYLGQPSPF